MRHQRAGQLRVGPADLPAEHLLEFAVLLDQLLHALLEPAALRIEILFERAGQLVVHFSPVTVQLTLQAGQHPLSLALDQVDVEPAAGLPQRQHADPQRVERKRLALRALGIGAQLVDRVPVFDREFQDQAIRLHLIEQAARAMRLVDRWGHG